MPEAFPHLSPPPNSVKMKIEWYLRIEGEGYRRLETSRFPFHATNPHNAIFQLCKRICLWTWRDPKGDVKGQIFHLLIIFHICPWIWITLCSTVNFNVHRVWCQFLWKELSAHNRHRGKEHSKISQGQIWNQQKMSLFIYHLLYQFYQLLLNLYIICKEKENPKTCII